MRSTTTAARRTMLALAGPALAGVLMAAVVAPAAASASPAAATNAAPASSAAPAEPRPNLHVEAQFDRDTYRPGDRLTLTITVSNIGTAPAAQVQLQNPDSTNDITWPNGMPDSGQFDLAPGESKTFTTQGIVAEGAYSRGFIDGILFYSSKPFEADATEGDNFGRPFARVPGATGTLVCQAIDSADVHATDGPPVAGVKVTVVEEFSGKQYATGTTDADGRFTLKDVPASRYKVAFESSPAWALTEDSYGPGGRISTYVVDGETQKFTAAFRSTGAAGSSNGQPAGPGSANDPAAPVNPAGNNAGAGNTGANNAGAGNAGAGSAGSAAGGGSAANAAVSASTGASARAASAGGKLPTTGPSAVLMVVSGVAIVAVGAGILLVTRRRRAKFATPID